MASAKARDSARCIECGEPGRVVLDREGPFCDSCADAHLSDITGYPRLPAPPPSEVIVGPDKRRHKIDYEIWRSPVGIAVEAVENRDGGYRAEAAGSHFADVAEMIERARSIIRERIGRLELERSPHGGHWLMSGWEVNGRFEWNEDSDLYDVVIDGRRLTWEEFGQAVSSFEGWEFKLSIETEGLPEDVVVEGGRSRMPEADEGQASATATPDPDGEHDVDDYSPPLRIMDSSHWLPAITVSPERKPRLH